jgi:hypothetical protein
MKIKKVTLNDLPDLQRIGKHTPARARILSRSTTTND